MDRLADRGRAVEHDVDRARSAPSSSWNFGSIALTWSTTSTVLASGWRCTASTSARLPSYQLAIWSFSTEFDDARDVAEAHRVAVAHGDDDVAEGVGVAQLRVGLDGQVLGVALDRADRRVDVRGRDRGLDLVDADAARRSAFGSSWMRTAYFWLPKICTWPTPLIVDSAGEITVCANASSFDSGCVSLCSASSSTGASAGLSLR